MIAALTIIVAHLHLNQEWEAANSALATAVSEVEDRTRAFEARVAQAAERDTKVAAAIKMQALWRGETDRRAALRESLLSERELGVRKSLDDLRQRQTAALNRQVCATTSS